MFSAIVNQTMFCWVASVSLSFTLCTCCFSINLQLSGCVQKLPGLLLDLTGRDQPESNTKQGNRLHLISVAFIPRHLPTCIFFLPRNLSIIRHIVQTKNIFIYNTDLTIIPEREWASGMGWMPWASPPITLCSLIRIWQFGNYFGSLAIVIATFKEFSNKNLVVTIVLKIPYPTTTFSPEQYSPSSQAGPSCKHWKVDHQTTNVEEHVTSKATALRPHLFNLVNHQMYMGLKPPVIAHGVLGEYTAGGENFLNISLAEFFTKPAPHLRFPSMDLLVPNKYRQLIDKNRQTLQKQTLHIDCDKLCWANKPTLPIYKFAGSFYWQGILLMLIYHYVLVDHTVVSYSKEELLPFIEANIFPNIFGPLLSQQHWKRGDKIIEVSAMVHHGWVETWEPSLFVRIHHQFQPGQSIVVTPGDYISQQGYIANICDDGEPQGPPSRKER